jgi:phytoene/squalene synthetase
MHEIIKTQDYDRYITTLFTRLNHREDIFAVISFNFELSKILRIVTEPMIGMIRFAWWREALEEAFNLDKQVRNHEILKSLRQLRERYGIEAEHFIKMVDAKQLELEKKAFKTFAEFKNYIEQTDVLVSKIICEITNVENKNIIIAAEKFSIAYGIVDEIREAFLNFSTNRFNLPEDVFEQCGARFENYGKDSFLETSKEAIERLVNYAKTEIIEGRTILAKIDLKSKQNAACPLLLGKVAEFYIKHIEENDFDVFTKPIFNELNPLQIIKLSLTNFLGKF